MSQSTMPSAAIVTPRIDLWLTGGGSVIVVLAVLLIGLVAPETSWLQTGFSPVPVLILQFVLNMPHFLASYRLLYGGRGQVRAHPFVSMYLPFLLAIVCIYAVLTPGMGPSGPGLANPWVVDFFGVTTTLLLAWHYTGQAWGMIASFSHMGGVRIDKTERLLIRSGLHVLLVWHVLWGVKEMFGPLERDPMRPPMQWVDQLRGAVPELFGLVHQAYAAWSVVALLSLPLGIYGFIRMSKRTGQRPPLRAVTPWVAIYMWYLLVWAHPGVFLLLQIFHAVQYLAFPFRVEVNQFVERHPDKRDRQRRHALYYYVALLAGGLVVFGIPQLAVFIGDKTMSVSAVAAGFVNLHHYFIDGVIWKIRNPQVQKALFAHLKPSS